MALIGPVARAKTCAAILAETGEVVSFLREYTADRHVHERGWIEGAERLARAQTIADVGRLIVYVDRRLGHEHAVRSLAELGDLELTSLPRLLDRVSFFDEYLGPERVNELLRAGLGWFRGGYPDVQRRVIALYEEYLPADVVRERVFEDPAVLETTPARLSAVLQMVEFHIGRTSLAQRLNDEMIHFAKASPDRLRRVISLFEGGGAGDQIAPRLRRSFADFAAIDAHRAWDTLVLLTQRLNVGAAHAIVREYFSVVTAADPKHLEAVLKTLGKSLRRFDLELALREDPVPFLKADSDQLDRIESVLATVRARAWLGRLFLKHPHELLGADPSALMQMRDEMRVRLNEERITTLFRLHFAELCKLSVARPRPSLANLDPMRPDKTLTHLVPSAPPSRIEAYTTWSNPH